MGRLDYTIGCRHVDKETLRQECIVSGNFPNWLNGFVLFNGPGILKVGDVEYNHAFDASAILQKFTIENGKVSYCSKYLQSETFKKNKEAGKIMVPEFGTPGPSSQGLMSRVINALDSEKIFTDNALLSIVHLGPKYFCMGETPFFLEINPTTLDVVNRVNMYKVCKIITQNYQILQDEGGSYFAFGLSYGIMGPKYAVVKLPKDGNVQEGKIVASFSCRWRMSPSYIHSAVMTENYLIFIETPLVVSLMELLNDFICNKPFFEGLKWQEEKKCLIHVIEIKTWKEISTKYVADAFFFLFFGNVYEEDNHIVMDICVYKDHSLMSKMFISSLREQNEKQHDETFAESFCPYLRRYVLPLVQLHNVKNDDNLVTLPNTTCTASKNGNEIHLTHDVLSNVPFGSLPVKNPKLKLHSKSRFIYSNFGANIHDCNYTTIVKMNVESRETFLYHEEDLYTGPPIFIPIPDGKNEDDGLILSLGVRSSDPNYICLLVISAKTMTEVCRARTCLETNAAVALNGIYIPT